MVTQRARSSSTPPGTTKQHTRSRRIRRAWILLICVATAVAMMPGVPAAAAAPVAADDDYTIPEEGTSAGNYRYERQWGAGHTYGLAVDGAGTVYVMNHSSGEVEVFDADGTALYSFGGNTTATPAPEGLFWQPQAIAVDSAGPGGAATAVYVADQYYARIQKFTPDGTFVRMWGWGVDTGASAFEVCTSGCQRGTGGSGAGQFHQPYGIAVDDSGTTVYVADSWNSRIQRFSSEGAYLSTWGTYGPGVMHLAFPGGVEVAGNGNVYVADTHNDRIVWFTADGGTQLGEFGSVGLGAGELWRPQDVAFDASGNVFVAEQTNNRIQQFTAAGVPVGQWGGEGTGDGELDSPNGVDVGPADAVYVADTWNDRVQKFASSPGGVLDNDTAGDGGTRTAVLDTDVAHGTLSLHPEGTFTYTPDPDWNGADTFTYHATDDGGASNVATVTITVAPFNDPPVSADDHYYVSVDGELVVSAPGVLSNDTDVDGDALTANQRGDVDHGTLTIDYTTGYHFDGGFTYVPDPGFTGTDTFIYDTFDGGFVPSGFGTVTLTVAPAIYVDRSATGDDDGSSWADAFTELQDALAVASPGNVIWVAEGTYLPDFDVTTRTHTGDASAAFETVHEVNMIGGYPAGGGSRDPEAHPTILSGDLLGDDVAGDPDTIDDNSITVVDLANTDLRLEGFTITAAAGQGIGGTTSGALIGQTRIEDNHGRGVAMTGATAHLFFAGSTISGNSAGTGAGGGVYLLGAASVRFADVVIEGNSAASGAGAYVDGTVTMHNTVFRGNTGVGATTDGGGLKLVAGSGDESTIMNAVFAGNAANVGSALVVDGGSVSVANSTFTGNTADPAGGTLIELAAGSVAVDNSIVWGNPGSSSIAGAAVGYSIVEGGAAGTAVLDVDPQFKDADGADHVFGTADDNVRLLGTSPAIDAGDNNRVPPDTLDLDNDADETETTSHDLAHAVRFFDRGNTDTGVSGNGYSEVVDMGAFELGNQPPNTQSDSYETNEDTPLVVSAPGVLGNDSDEDGDEPLTAQATGWTQNGTLDVLDSDGSFTFTPTADFNGEARFSYDALDPTGAASAGDETATVTVHPVNDEPSFHAGSAVSVAEDSPANTVPGWATAIDAGAADESAQNLTFTATPAVPSLFSAGPAVDAVTGALTFTPAPDAFGSTTVDVVLTDDGGTDRGGDDTSATATFTITIDPVNDEPYLQLGDDVTVPEGSTSHTFSGWASGIHAGASNEATQSLSVALTPANGSLFSVPPSLDIATGDLTFALAPGATGSTLVTVTLIDDGGTANGGDDTFVDSFTITIGPSGPPEPPGADDWSFAMDEGGTISGSVLEAGDGGGGGCSPTVVLVSGVSHGTLTLAVDGTFSYVHDGTAATTDSFTYRVLCDGLESRVATVTIQISLLRYSVGLVDPATGEWHLRSSFTTDVDSFYFGNPGDVPFMGDWDCDGIDTPGLFRLSDAYAYLRNSNSQGIADIRFFFGDPGDIPLPGDFNGDGCDTLSLYRPSTQTFYIMNELGEDEGGLGAADYAFLFGNPGDKPVVGDWDGDGITEIGLHRESTGFFYWRNTLDTGIASDEIFFGDPGDRFVAGDFGTINGFDTPAVFRPTNTTFYFRHSLTEGVADSEFIWGESAWLPVAGVAG